MSADQCWWSPLRPAIGCPSPRARLLVVPHSGGGPNGYLRLLGDLPSDVELYGLTLPGRERRLGEPAGTSVDEVLDSLATIPGPWPPTVVFGHSLGGSLGLLLAARLGERCTGLVASGQTPGDRDRWIDDLDTDEELLGLLDLGGGTLPEALDHPAWRATVLSTLRADLRLGAETADRSTGVRINAPITALAGLGDRLIDLDAMSGWAEHTTARFEVHTIPGGHFAVLDPEHRAAVLNLIDRHLAAVPARSL